MVYGTISAEPCHPLCMGAAGPSCSCACSGRNHGSLWTQTGIALASEIKAWRDREDEAEARRQAKITAERNRKAREWSEWAETHSGLLALLDSERDALAGWPNEFLTAMAEKVDGREILSPNMVGAVERCITGRRAAALRKEDREARSIDVPYGRVKLAGEIVATYTRANYLGDGDDLFMVVQVETPEGLYRVKGKVPSSLRQWPTGIRRSGFFIQNSEYRGLKIAMAATLGPDVWAEKNGRAEKGVGIFKNPRNAEFTHIDEMASA